MYTSAIFGTIIENIETGERRILNEGETLPEGWRIVSNVGDTSSMLWAILIVSVIAISMNLRK